MDGNPFLRVIDDLAGLAVRLAARFQRRRLVAVAEDQQVAIYQSLKGGALRPYAPNPAAGRGGQAAGELRLPADVLLTRKLSFPSAARDVLEPVLDSRLDRLTPWSADRVVYGYDAAPDGDAVSVTFVAVARDIAEEWTSRAEAAGFTPTALGSGDEPLDRPLVVDLWRGVRNPARRRARRRLAIAGLAAAALLTVGSVSSYRDAAAAEQRLAALERRGAVARSALGMTGLGGLEARLIAAKRPETSIVLLIDRISRALPDGAVLRELEIAPDKIRLAGDSDAAPELIGLLRAGDAVTDARFAAPVTRRGDGRDGFEILGAGTALPPGKEGA